MRSDYDALAVFVVYLLYMVQSGLFHGGHELCIAYQKIV